ncbi:MAG: hypothetical protein ACP5OO_00785 [Chloroflexia bacterium]
MTERFAEDITVRTHLAPSGEKAHGAVFIGRLGAFRFEAVRDRRKGWVVSFSPEPEIPAGLNEPLTAAALSSISVAEGLHRQPPPGILSVTLEDLQDETLGLSVDVRDILPEAGIAQGFVLVEGRGRFTFQADRQADGDWSIAFGLDFPLPEDTFLMLERIVVARIEERLKRRRRKA